MVARRLCLAMLMLLPTRMAGDHGPSPHTGLIVENLFTGSAAHEAGLRAGDRILSWSRPAPCETGLCRGILTSEQELLDLATEVGPRGPVTLAGDRLGKTKSWVLRTRRWGLTVRPELPALLWLLYRQGLEASTAGDCNVADARWRQAADETGHSPALSTWFLLRLATRQRMAGQWDLAQAAYRDAVAMAEQAGLDQLAAHGHREWARDLLRQSAWQEAREHLLFALRVHELAGDATLNQASTLFSLSFATSLGGDLDQAASQARQALALRERLAPESYVVALSLSALGALEVRRAEPSTARALLIRAVELHRRVAPPGPDLAGTLVNLGNVEDTLGAIAAARAAFAEALSIYDQTIPRSDGKARALAGMALLDLASGDLAQAEAGLEGAINLWSQVGGEPVNRAKALSGLAEIARKRGHLPMAESYLGQAFEIRQALAPASLELAVDLANLGALALDRKDFAKARRAFEQALAMQRQLAAGSPTVGSLLVSLGRVELLSKGSLERAEASIRSGLEQLETSAPVSLLRVGALVSLAGVREKQGFDREVLALLREAQTLTLRLAPDSATLAEILHRQGKLAQRLKKAGASELLCEAVEVIERQRRQLGGSVEVRSTFELATERIYFACADAQVATGKAAAAFETTERSRACSFLALLDQRDLAVDESAELAAQLRHLEAEDDRLQKELAAARARGSADVVALERKRRDTRRQRETLRGKARHPYQALPRSPLSLAEARAQLDSGTLLLAYFVGEESSLLFVVEAEPSGSTHSPNPGFAVHRLPVGREAIERWVTAFRSKAGNRPDGPSLDSSGGDTLYGELLGPVEQAVARADRLLISPDGPLHALPFAALRHGQRFLVEDKALHLVASATVYAEFRNRRGARPAHDFDLVAFGDPDYGPAATTERGFLTRAGATPRLVAALPASREEVEAIGALFDRQRVLFGAEATEENAKALSGKARLLHFACHGLLDTASPLDSGLALSPSGKAGAENGLLQAWEIFESLELSADLVTLSACETALGPEMGGEGLLGLTRSLHYAGARTVLASLWNVSDRSTAGLMKAFYGHLAAGRTKDEALRLAQLELLRSGDGAFAHPYHWAAFQLYGDFR